MESEYLNARPGSSTGIVSRKDVAALERYNRAVGEHFRSGAEHGTLRNLGRDGATRRGRRPLHGDSHPWLRAATSRSEDARPFGGRNPRLHVRQRVAASLR